MIAVQPDPFDAAALLADFAGRSAGAGAIATFTGLVRGENDGSAVSALELDFHPRLTQRAVAGIAADAAERFGLIDVAIVHRHGILAPGEAIVFVAAAAQHRRAAFDAVDYVMDRLKTEAPFWKREQRSDGAHWIEARERDHSDHLRWG
ncbi:molybdenum cofactor biosynthesis protein MoaE [Allosphingosinicella sp.]|jgi:molybdopterin synthase catalytic subunit|uniref:molybdenum cofactor biosynthesis protein MoaE n=1 Tax=Allosphingosinicella sp. TaxID=2823234 RepID=UPI002F05D5BB